MENKKMNDFKISVIVPVYNVKKYLSQCLENLIFQTHKNIEIIIVDDGSTDNSEAIYNKYASQDRRIVKIIKQENAGQSAARNKALLYAKGDYIHFMDSDDYIDLDYYEKMLKAAVSTDADMASSGIYLIEDLSCSVIFYQRVIFSDIDDKIHGTKISYAPGVPRFLFKRSFIEKIGLSFEVGRVCEDVMFLVICAYRSNKIVLVSDTFYYANYNLNSTTRTEDKYRSAKRKKDELYVWALAAKFAAVHSFQIRRNEPKIREWTLFKHKLFSKLTLMRKKVYQDEIQYCIFGGKLCFLKTKITRGFDDPKKEIL
jgi:CDP-glycerol glycerophosphotransferase